MNMCYWKFLFSFSFLVLFFGCKPNYIVHDEVQQSGFSYSQNGTSIGEAYAVFSYVSDTASVTMEVRDWVDNDHWFTREKLIIEGITPYRDVRYNWQGDAPIRYSYKMYNQKNGQEVCSYALDQSMPQFFASNTEIERYLYGWFDNFFIKDAAYQNDSIYPEFIHLSNGYFQAFLE